MCSKYVTPARRDSAWRKAVILCVLSLSFSGCGENAENPNPTRPEAGRNNLNTMTKARISIGDHQLEVWLAKDDQQRQFGLMRVTENELASFQGKTDHGLSDIHRGMLFVFPFEQPLSFWMRNTIIPLDIAYIRGDGKIVGIHTMAPLENRTYPSGEPALLALEVKAGLFESLGIKVDDSVQIPDDVLKAGSR